MPTPIGDAFVNIRANTDKLKGDLDQGVTKATQGASKEMGNLSNSVKAVGAAAGVWIAGKALGAVKDFVVGAVNAASDLDESINAVSVAFGENADEINRIGENAATQLGLSQAEFNTHAVSLSAFVEQIAGDTGDVVGTLEDITGRATDFASVMNLEVGDALQKFRSGLAGESEPLRQYGIDVSAAKVEQVALAAGIIETGETMTEAQKVQARYLAIMQQTEKVAGDFANTSEGFANQQRILNALWTDAQAEIGKKLLPAFEKFQRVMINLIPVLTRVIGHVADLAAGTLGLADPIFALVNLIPGLNAKVEEGANAWDGLLTVLKFVTAPLTVIGEQLTGMVDIISGNVAPTEEYTAELEKATEAMEGGVTTSQDWLREQANFPDAFTATEEELDTLVGTVQQYVIDAERGRFRSDEYAAALRDQTVALEDTEEAQTELNAEVTTSIALDKQALEQLRGKTNALFGLESALDAQAEAEAAVNALVEKGLTDTPEYTEAVKAWAEANIDVKAAQQELIAQGGQTREEFVNQQIALGLTRQAAEDLAAEYDHLFTPRTVDHTIRFNEVAGSQYSSSIGGRQHGGPVSGGTPYLVGEAGPEIFVPRIPGSIIPNNNITTGGINATVNVTVGAGVSRADGMMVGVEVERALRRLAESRTVA